MRGATRILWLVLLAGCSRGNDDDEAASDADADTDSDADAGDNCYEGDFQILDENSVEVLKPYDCVTGDLYVYPPGPHVLDLPELERIDGDLVIDGTSLLIDLEGLSGLAAIGGNLRIYQNTGLTGAGPGSLASVGGDVKIDFNTALEDLDLSVLAAVGGKLTINGNHEVTSLDLTALTSVEELTVSSTALTGLEGLSQLASVDGDLQISVNPDLEDLDGLSHLSSVGGSLSIFANEALASLGGLSQLTSVGGGILVASSDALEDLNGLHNIASVGRGLYVEMNESLESLELTALETVGCEDVPADIECLRIDRNGSLPQCAACDVLEQLIGFTGTYLFIDNLPDTCPDTCDLE